jgi:histidinol-phosphate aminotransferase
MSVVVGVGGRESARPDALLDLVGAALADHGLAYADVTTVTTLDRRARHAGVQLLAVATDAGILPFAAGDLSGQPVDHPSETVARHTGTPSVAEAAVRASGATPLGPPVARDDWVVVVGRHRPTTAAMGDEGTGRAGGGEAEHELEHHGDLEVQPGMLDFAVNVHGERPPAFLRVALAAAIDDLARYPDAREAEAAVAAAHGVPEGCVLLTHGAAEAFTLVAQQPWQRPAVVHPQFTEPEAALRAAGHRPARLLTRRETGFRLEGEALLPASGTDLVVVGNPTNPTSRLHTPDELATLRATDRLLVVDEAFMDAVEDVAAPRHSLVREAAHDPGLLVIRSLTKTFALAGLRVGYVVGHPDRLAELRRRRTPWPVSTLASAAAVACLAPEGRAYADVVRAALPTRTAHLAATLERHGFEVVPDPAGPFVLARRDDAAAAREALRQRGVAVRRGDTFPGLDASWLRFAAREAEAVDALDLALRGA